VTKLAFEAPLDWPGILRFLRARAIPGLESVDESTYRRGDVTIALDSSGDALILDTSDPEDRLRTRHLFDLDASPRTIRRHLSKDPLLNPRKGLRVPGCWEPFELAVRAVVGQQISVKGASTLMGRLYERTGLKPEAIAGIDLTGVGLTRFRAETLRALARATVAEGLSIETLSRIRGIGPWTVQYIAMRAFKDSDAFPAEDLILRRAASPNGDPLTAKQLLTRAEAWRPYRAYAVIALWQAYAERLAK
jgi:AraC family transcriptional regulator of adaptative response / DNA-3-methyladenine glycosylase II